MAIYTQKITSFKEGMSISCAGICLTVVNYENYENGYLFNVYISNETLSKTTLANYEVGDQINLEKSLALVMKWMGILCKAMLMELRRL